MALVRRFSCGAFQYTLLFEQAGDVIVPTGKKALLVYTAIEENSNSLTENVRCKFEFRSVTKLLLGLLVDRSYEVSSNLIFF